jgi:cellobiose phosphorylase
MNRVGEKGIGSSVWLSWFLYDNLKKLSELLNYKKIKNNLSEIADTLKDNVNKNAWDGEWYIRGRYDSGAKLGGKGCNECEIDLIAQAWAKISGAGEPEKINTALNSAYNRLFDKEYGIFKLLDPPFDKTTDDPGYIKSYIPGIRENGGQYTHVYWLFILL